MPLYRHLDDWNAVTAHLEGKLWLHSFQYFRNIEDAVRRDTREGRASGLINGGMHVTIANDEFSTQAIYILSFSQLRRLPSFGEHVVVVKNEEALSKRIESALPRSARCLVGPVKYTNQVGYVVEPSPKEIFECAVFTKPWRYAPEQEYRLVAVFPPGFKISNDRLELDLGDLSNIFEIEHEGEHKTSFDPDGFKPLHHVMSVDVRNNIFVKGASGEKIKFHEFHNHISNFYIIPEAPEEVQTHFNAAKNLYLYAWYTYRLSSPAQAHTYAALEMALKDRCIHEGLDLREHRGLGRLLETAIYCEWIKDDGFPHIFSDKKTGMEELGISRKQYDPNGFEFCWFLQESIPNFRNGIAHGGTLLLDPWAGTMALEVTTAIINQLK